MGLIWDAKVEDGILELKTSLQNCRWEIRIKARRIFMNISLGNEREKWKFPQSKRITKTNRQSKRRIVINDK